MTFINNLRTYPKQINKFTKIRNKIDSPELKAISKIGRAHV